MDCCLHLACSHSPVPSIDGLKLVLQSVRVCQLQLVGNVHISKVHDLSDDILGAGRDEDYISLLLTHPIRLHHSELELLCRLLARCLAHGVGSGLFLCLGHEGHADADLHAQGLRD